MVDAYVNIKKSPPQQFCVIFSIPFFCVDVFSFLKAPVPARTQNTARSRFCFMQKRLRAAVPLSPAHCRRLKIVLRARFVIS